MKKYMVLVLLLAGVLYLAVLPAMSITWCHDYSYYVVTGKDTNKISPVQLRSTLLGMGYKMFPFTNAAQDPQAQSRLRQGDVIIIGNDHSGVVNSKGLIDHFIQVFGASGTAYTFEEIQSMDNFLHDWTLFDMVNFKRETPDGRFIFPYKDKAVEVWRKR